MSFRYCKEYIEKTYKTLINSYNSNWDSNFQSYAVQLDLYRKIINLTKLSNCPDWIKTEVFCIKHPKDHFWINWR